MNITKDIFYVGVNDREIDLFEGQFVVPEGMAYNSYVIADEKTAVTDTVDARFADEWLKNIGDVLGDKAPDYLIIHHMEPDHSSSIKIFCDRYPEAVLVGNGRTFTMLKAFFDGAVANPTMTVADGDELSLGSHKLTFVFAPMVHWPEVMLSFDSTDKVLFSADAFGKFGALDADEDWACEARRYYFGIVGKYGAQVQGLLKKAETLPIEIICPLHGPILTENLSYYIGLYDTWSSYGVESEGICIAFTSVYGNTKEAAELLKEKLLSKGCKKVAFNDLAREDMAECIEDAFRYGTLVLGTTTYNGDIFPFMKQFIDGLTERGYRNRKIAFIENGSWAPVAARKMKTMLEGSKDITFLENTVTVRSALSDDSKAAVERLADELMA